MKRMQLFEFEDLRRFPSGLRDCMTLYIQVIHRLLGTDKLVAPLLARALRAAGTDQVVDLCSGAGGPLPAVTARLAEEHDIAANVTLTDLYPNEHAAGNLATKGSSRQLTYHMAPVDAGQVPAELVGVRSMICSFHHMPPTTARRILEDAFKQRKALCIFEISDNAFPRWLWWLALPVNLLMVFALTPLVRPLRMRQVLFTYAIPVLPLVIAWDGAASNARTYTEADVRELLQGLDSPEYHWEVGTLRPPRAPGGMIYVLGLPGTAASA